MTALTLAAALALASACQNSVDPMTIVGIATHESRLEPLTIHDNAGGRGYRPADRQEAVRLAARQTASSSDVNPASHHVGYYLIGAGREEFEACVRGKRWMPSRWRNSRHVPLAAYTGTILLVTGGISALLLVKAYDEGARGWTLALLVPLVVLGTSQLASALTNWVATLVTKPMLLPARA